MLLAVREAKRPLGTFHHIGMELVLIEAVGLCMVVEGESAIELQPTW